MRGLIHIGVLVTMACFTTRVSAATGGSFDAWASHHDALLKTPGLARLYEFEGAMDAQMPIPNQAGVEGDLRYELIPMQGAPNEKFSVIQGRWPKKQALRFDRGVLNGSAVNMTERAFSVEMWFRKNGYGSFRGNGGNTDGTLIAQGNGYNDGFRVTTSYPSGNLNFEIGRQQGAMGINGAPNTADGVWNHMVATWNGKLMRLYVNGLLQAEQTYDGSYTAKPDARLRIGYNDAGWGSIKLDVDEVAIYTRALSASEVLRHSLFYGGITQAIADKALQMRDTTPTMSLAQRISGFRQLVGAPHLTADDRYTLGQLVLGEQSPVSALDPAVSDRFAAQSLSRLVSAIRAGQGIYSATAPSAKAASANIDAIFQRANGLASASPSDRFYLRLGAARSNIAFGIVERGLPLYKALMIAKDAPADQKQKLRLEFANALCACHQYDQARAEYARLATSQSTTTSERYYVRLLRAQSYLRQQDYAGAQSALRLLLADKGLPYNNRFAAQEALQRATRLKAHLPANDPLASRLVLNALPKPAVELFVAPNGSDANPGTSDKPLASLQGAVQALRALRQSSAIPKGGAAVVFAGGAYHIDKGVELTAEDGGTPTAPVVFRAAQGAAVWFSGGASLKGFEPVTDSAVLERIPEQARGHVLQLNLRALGISDYGMLARRGYGNAGAPVTDLYVDGQPMTLARWPNDETCATGEITPLTDGFSFGYTEDRAERWAHAKDAWAFGYFTWLWADMGVKIGAIDTEAKRITINGVSADGVHKGMPYYVYNLLEELDAPGEWYLDRDTGILYFYPPKPLAGANVQLSMLTQPFIKITGASNVVLQRLGFECSRSGGVQISEGDSCQLQGCSLRCLGYNAVTITGGRHHGVFGCDLQTLARGGVKVTGGDRKTLTPCAHFVENCHIRDFSRWDRTYTPAVFADGVGIRIAHNLMHDSPGHAMRIEGNDHYIGYNEVHDVVYETDDQGALDMWFNPGYRGVQIVYNYWHHNGDGKDKLMRAGVRLDDAISGVLMYGNVFYKTSEGYFGAIQVHGGKDNAIDNNVFVDCKYGVSFSGWGEERWKQFLQQSDVQIAIAKAVDITAPPYSTRYPELARIAQDEGVNLVCRNLALGCGEFLTRDRNRQQVYDNVLRAAPSALSASVLSGVQAGAISGFNPVPFGEMGLYSHPLRASWPVANPVGARWKMVDGGRG